MNFKIITIFPDFFTSPLRYGVLARAIKEGIIKVEIYNLRDYTRDLHRSVDDKPYGGGAGMVMMVEPIWKAVNSVRTEKSRVILLSASGKLFTQDVARELAREDELILICGRYEGVDERVAESIADMELSIGNFVLSGGETAALAVIETVSRLIPGVVGKEESVENESFSDGLLEHPQYTRPREFMGMKVPDVLFSGNHGKIEEWKKRAALEKTMKNRPDLIKKERKDGNHQGD